LPFVFILLQDDITTKWLNTNFMAFNATHYMYEKYNALEVTVHDLCIVVYIQSTQLASI